MSDTLKQIIRIIKCKNIRSILLEACNNRMNFNLSTVKEKEKYVIVIIISNLIKNYELKDFTWKNLCELQNINLYEMLKMIKAQNNSNLNLRVEFMISAYEKKARLPGHIFYKNIILDIFITVCQKSNKGILPFLEARNRGSVRNVEKWGEDSLFLSKILNDYPREVSMNYMIIGAYSRKDEKYGEGVININCNTENKFLKTLYNDFYQFYNLNGSNNKCLRVFYYIFSERTKELNISSFNDFNFKILQDIYEELVRIEKKEKFHYLYGSIIMFYRFLVKKSREEGCKINLTNIEKDAVMSDGLVKILKGRYSLVEYNPLEKVPSFDKICIIPNRYTMRNSYTRNSESLFIDFTNIDKRIRGIYKDFFWNNNGSIFNKKSGITIIKEFTEYILKNSKNKGEFINSENIYLYRKYLEEKYEYSKKTAIKCRLKAVRKFLKYYVSISEDYESMEVKIIFDILTLRGLEVFDGGEVITANDLKLIYAKLVEREKIHKFGKLYTLVFELFNYSNLRLGEILNLKVDCICGNSGKRYIKYFPKIGGKELVYIPIDERIETIVLEAKRITDRYRGNTLIDEYIFIEQYLRVAGGNKRIKFGGVFTGIIHELNESLEKKYYKPMNIRHTYMNTVCNEAIKKNLSLKDIEGITNDSVKTIRKYYQDRNRVELMAEIMSGVTISNVDIDGRILKNDKKLKAKNVKGNLGKCTENMCNFDIAECLICRNFITFINRKNIFLKKIKECDQIIHSTNNELLKMEKISEKKLLAKYFAEIMKLEIEEKNNA
ncbi:MAG: hypothetical protein ACRCYE_12395 [Sarcina sp.]